MEALKEANLIKPRYNEELKPRLLVKQKWGLRNLIVFDIWHDTYDPMLGHLSERNHLPVLVVHFNGRGHTKVRAAEPGLQRRINQETSDIHNLHGKDARPPYIVDHTLPTPPVFLDPRDPKLLSQPSKGVGVVDPAQDSL
jgi:hypothetical protein